jgi:hypothetical protein
MKDGSGSCAIVSRRKNRNGLSPMLARIDNIAA